MRSKKILMAFVLCAIIAIGAALWIGRYTAFYNYYLWRLNHTTKEEAVIERYEDIERISTHMVPLLVRTYEDASASEKSRTAAGIGLIRADKNRAETLFLENNDDEIYPALYYYYLWRLNHTIHGSLMIDLHEDIKSIAPHIVPLLVRTYEDVNISETSRNVAGYGLVKGDMTRAIDVFIPFLENEDDEIVRLAIIHLGAAKSHNSFEKITGFAHHPNAEIRRAVTKYLGDIGNAESISLLKEMMENDPDEDVQRSARNEKYKLGDN